MHAIVLGDGKRIPVAQYCRIVRAAKADPRARFERSFSDALPTTGTWLLRQFGRMVADHCNRGLDVTSGHSAEHYLLRRMRQGRLWRECRWCGAAFQPTNLWQKYCSTTCERDYWA